MKRWIKYKFKIIRYRYAHIRHKSGSVKFFADIQQIASLESGFSDGFDVGVVGVWLGFDLDYFIDALAVVVTVACNFPSHSLVIVAGNI